MVGHSLPDKPPAALESRGVSFREATRVWVRVALLSFGGAAGQIAVMHRARQKHAVAFRSDRDSPSSWAAACCNG
jgi:hypothetical protein